jgi:hypothetical protein
MPPIPDVFGQPTSVRLAPVAGTVHLLVRVAGVTIGNAQQIGVCAVAGDRADVAVRVTAGLVDGVEVASEVGREQQLVASREPDDRAIHADRRRHAAKAANTILATRCEVRTDRPWVAYEVIEHRRGVLRDLCSPPGWAGEPTAVSFVDATQTID